jgi:2',3'-cyclic-nucleotide 2'-phosphodiesterase/3'-nucleotidase/5'-nucleotidase
MDYITASKTINPSADNNWSIAPISGNVKVTFTSSPKAETYAKTTDNIAYTGQVDEKGFGVFTLDVSKAVAPSLPAADPVTEQPAVAVFKDVPVSHWAAGYINSLTADKIISGKTADTFDPNGLVTRAEFASLLTKALKLQVNVSPVFKDVPASAWYAGAVAAAHENKLVSGVTADTFAPNASITREQMAVMVKQGLDLRAGKILTASTAVSFSDSASISAWAASAVAVAVDKKIIAGRTDGSFAPKATATRAEAAKVISSLLSASVE